MELEKRTVRFDNNLKVEAYRFEGIMQKFPNHFHDYYVMGFVESGRRYLICKNKEYTINAGNLLLFNPLDNHACEQIDGKTLDWRCINIKEDIMRRIVKEITDNEYLPQFTSTVVYTSEAVTVLKELHEMIMNEQNGFKKKENFYFLIEQLINYYTEPITQTLAKDSIEIQKACDYMKNNYIKTITLNDLSKITDLKKYTLLRRFIKERGVTPYQYLETIRISQAKKLLERGVSPLETALQTGFTDQSHFTKFFKNFIGLTPKQYQDIFNEDNACPPMSGGDITQKEMIK